MKRAQKLFFFTLTLVGLGLGCYDADSPDATVEPLSTDDQPTLVGEGEGEGEGEGDCDNGMKNGEVLFDGCNEQGCQDGRLWTTDADCSCRLENGQHLEMNQVISMDDGCTTCTCAGWSGLECDASACAPGQAAGYCSNGMKEGELVWYGCWGRECFNGGVVELDGEWQCNTETGEVVRTGEIVTLEDGCTVCSCSCGTSVESGPNLSCDSSACAPAGKDCESGLLHGESYFDGCNTITCEDGELWTTTVACNCHLEDGTSIEHQQSITLDDGMTCTCVAQDKIECYIECE